MLNTCLRTVSGGLLGGRLRTSFVYAFENKVGVNEGSVGRTMVGLACEDISVAVLG